MTDADIIAEFSGYRCWTSIREGLLRSAIERGHGEEVWSAAMKRFNAGQQNSSNSSSTWLVDGAGVDDEGFAVALEQECRRVLGYI